MAVKLEWMTSVIGRVVLALILAATAALPVMAQESGSNGDLARLWATLDGEDVPGYAAGEPGSFQYLTNFSLSPAFGIGSDGHSAFVGLVEGSGVEDVSDYFFPAGLSNTVPPIDPHVTVDGIPIPDGWQAFNEEGPIEGDVLPVLESPSMVWGVDTPELDLTCSTPFAVGRAWLGDREAVSVGPPWEEGALEADLPGHGGLAGASRIIEFSCYWGDARVTAFRNHPDFGTRTYGPLDTIALVGPGRVVFINAAREVGDSVHATAFAQVGNDPMSQTSFGGPSPVVVPYLYEGDPSQVLLTFVEPEASGGLFLLGGSVLAGTAGCDFDFADVLLMWFQAASPVGKSQTWSLGMHTAVTSNVLTISGTSPSGAMTTKTVDSEGNGTVETTGPSGETCAHEGPLNDGDLAGPHVVPVNDAVALATGGDAPADEDDSSDDPADSEPVPISAEPDDGSGLLAFLPWGIAVAILFGLLYYFLVYRKGTAYKVAGGDYELDPIHEIDKDLLMAAESGTAYVEDATIEKPPCVHEREKLAEARARLAELQAELDQTDDPQSETFQALVRAIRGTNDNIRYWEGRVKECEAGGP